MHFKFEICLQQFIMLRHFSQNKDIFENRFYKSTRRAIVIFDFHYYILFINVAIIINAC